MNTRTVIMKGRKMTLSGRELKIGERLPAFVLTDASLSSVTEQQFKGKVMIISCIPSVDTPVCSLETRRFNQEIVTLTPDVVMITVSKDLPFAQARWCAAHNIQNILLLSDYKNEGFAENYGVLIPEIGLLARALFVIDQEGIIQYIQIVSEVSQEPDYTPVLNKARELIKRGK